MTRTRTIKLFEIILTNRNLIKIEFNSTQREINNDHLNSTQLNTNKHLIVNHFRGTTKDPQHRQNIVFLSSQLMLTIVSPHIITDRPSVVVSPRAFQLNTTKHFNFQNLIGKIFNSQMNRTEIEIRLTANQPTYRSTPPFCMLSWFSFNS